MDDKKSSVQRVLDKLENLNLPTQFKDLPQSTRTAREAAAAVNCHVGQIVKSLVFQTKSTQKPILVLTSGSDQVNEAAVGAVIGEEINFASAEFVREVTDFAIGGVSPFGLKGEITTYIDEDLLQHPVIWAAAGSHNAVFSICPEDLVNVINGKVITVV